MFTMKNPPLFLARSEREAQVSHLLQWLEKDISSLELLGICHLLSAAFAAYPHLAPQAEGFIQTLLAKHHLTSEHIDALAGLADSDMEKLIQYAIAQASEHIDALNSLADSDMEKLISMAAAMLLE
jgi:hypothetical protein